MTDDPCDDASDFLTAREWAVLEGRHRDVAAIDRFEAILADDRAKPGKRLRIHRPYPFRVT